MREHFKIENYKGIIFEKIVCNYKAGAEDEKHIYDVIMPIDDELSDETLSTIYINQLLEKFDSIPTIKRNEFVDYQIESYKEKSTQWLSEVSGFLNDYYEEINSISRNLAKDFQEIIARKMKPTFSSHLTWAGTDTDLLVLTKALFERGVIKSNSTPSVTQMDIDKAFAKLFNMEEIKDTSRKLNSARAMKVNKSFVEQLKDAWDAYISEKNK